MTDELLNRQEPLGLTIPSSVAVVGCGGVGSWCALYLAMAGVPELWLFDHDTVSEHNRNRLPVPPDAVGKLKSEAVRDEILRLRPDCHVYACRGFDADLMDQLGISQIPWVVATTDTAASRRMIYQWANDNWANYIEAAAEGEYGSCTGEPAQFSTPDETAPGYQSVPVWVGSATMGAVAACYHILHNTGPMDRTYRMGWDGVEERLDLQTHDPAAYRDLGVTTADAVVEQIPVHNCIVCHDSTSLSCSLHPAAGPLCPSCRCPQCVEDQRTGISRQPLIVTTTNVPDQPF